MVKTNAGAVAVAAPFSEADKVAWRLGASKGVIALLEARVSNDKVLTATVAAATIDWQANGGATAASNDYFDGLLTQLRLETAGDKVAMRAATVATGLNRKDKDKGREAGKMLDSIASAMEGLALLVGPTYTWRYDDAVTKDLIKRTAAAGGLRKLSDLARNEAIDDNPRGVIRMDAKVTGEIVGNLVREKLTGAAGRPLVLARPGDDGKLAMLDGISSFSVEELEAILGQRDLSEGRPQALHELTQACLGIAVEDTGLVKVHDADPKSKKSAKRQTEPHVIICPGGDIVVSAHLAIGASNVVRIRGMANVLDEWPAHHAMLPPQVWRKLALNLAKPAQRNVVEITEEAADPAAILAERTWHMRSAAALNTRYRLNGAGLKFSPRIPTYGDKGDNRDTVYVVREDRIWEPAAEIAIDDAPDGFRRQMLNEPDRFKSAASKKTVASLATEAGRLVVTAGKTTASSIVKGSLPAMQVMASDLAASFCCSARSSPPK